MRKRSILIASGLAVAIATSGSLAAATTLSSNGGVTATRSAAQPARAATSPYTQLGQGEKVIFDTDFGQLNDDSQALFMLTQSKARVLGVTTVSGNTWAEEGAAYALRQLERVGRSNIPVYQGATEPLFGSRQATLDASRTLYGGRSYVGAWGHKEPANYQSVPDVYDGSPHTQIKPGAAADFIVNAVKKNPHQVSILAIGPLTNIALAVKTHPEIVPLVKQIIYMGGAFDVPGNDGAPASEFNIWFDPDSARIVWAAPWAKQTVVPLDVTDTVLYGIDQYNRVVDGPSTTIKEQFKDEQGPDFAKDPQRKTEIYDTLTVGVLLEPDMVTQSSQRKITVDTVQGLDYGRTLGYTTGAPTGLQSGTIVQRLNNGEFFDLYAGLLSARVTH